MQRRVVIGAAAPRRRPGFRAFVMSEAELLPSFLSPRLSPGLLSSPPDSTGGPARPSRSSGGTDDGAGAGGALINLSLRRARHSDIRLVFHDWFPGEGKESLFPGGAGLSPARRLMLLPLTGQQNQQNFQIKKRHQTPAAEIHPHTWRQRFS